MAAPRKTKTDMTGKAGRPASKMPPAKVAQATKLLQKTDMTVRQVAKALKVSEGNVRYWCGSKAYQAQIAAGYVPTVRRPKHSIAA